MPYQRLRRAPIEPRDLISLSEAADILCVHPRTIRRFISSGELKGFRVGAKTIRVSRADVKKVLKPVLPGE